MKYSFAKEEVYSATPEYIYTRKKYVREKTVYVTKILTDADSQRNTGARWFVPETVARSVVSNLKGKQK